jgi:hypothetical protein
MRWSVATALLVVSAVACAQTSPYQPGRGLYPKFGGKTAEPGITYGVVPGLPLPKTILYSVSPDVLAADAESWAKLGFGAFFVTGVASEWSTDVWAADGEPWTIGRSDKTWQTLRRANERCKALGAETFLTMAFSHTFDWFDDLAWQKIENNFRQFGLFAKSSGCTGVAIDVEYIGEQYHFDWAGYDYVGYTRADLVAKVRARAAQIARAIYDVFPEAPLLSFPESGFGLGSWLHAAWVEEAARRNAPGGVHLCTEFTYRDPNIRYMFAHAWLCDRVIEQVLSERGKAYWRKKCSIAEGLWPFGVDSDGELGAHGLAPSPDEFRQAFAASLMVGSRYNWIYAGDAFDPMLGRSNQGYPGQPPVADYLPVLRERKIATNPKYVRLAQELRRLDTRDYGPDLGLELVPALTGPREALELDIMPAGVFSRSPNATVREALWQIAPRLRSGEPVDLPAIFPVQAHWMLIGPFGNTDGRGFDAVYPPEKGISLGAEAEGVGGKVRWTEYRGKPGGLMVDLAKVFTPSEQVCAYALCYVHADRACNVQVRVSGNDTWKLWVGGKLVRACSDPGRIYLDREVLPVSLPAGTTPILLKVCNDLRDWGFVLRLTDTAGKPMPGLRIDTKPE